MTKPDLGLPSGIQDSTYQQNRENELKFNEESFLRLLEENSNYRARRISDMETIISLKEEVVELKGKIVVLLDLSSPLKITG